jgi:GT2 family glycosyltransferase/2-polyprenyl-3-methyl-5-hydroxy-6-metoxy-1,4-benzoquinol methylase/glycosyltransferase involved in cell wall biosynthesis
MADRRARGTVTEGEALRYDTAVDLRNRNNSHSLLVLMTGEDKDVLEIGPATGYMTRVLLQRDCLVTGIEIDPAAAELAEPFCERMIVGDIEQLSFRRIFRKRRFDVVIYGDVLEHLVDPERVLAETASILKPGGYVLASIPNATHGSVRLALLSGRFRYTQTGILDETHLHFYDRAGVTELFDSAGYRIVQWKRTRLDLFDTEARLRREDFFPELVEQIRQDPEALTFQHVVKAVPERRRSAVRRKRLPSNRRALEGIRRLGAHIASVERRARQLDERIRQKESVIAQKESLIEEKDEAAEESDRLIADLEMAVAARDAMIREKDEHLAERDARLGELWEDRERISREVGEIREAAGYRLLQGLRRRLHHLFPRGTRRGRFYERFVRFARRRFERRAQRVRAEAQPEIGSSSPDETYARWIEATEPSPAGLEEQRVDSRHLAYRPTISVVMPTWNPPIELLREAVGSVLAQTYGDWELCIADGGSQRAVRKYLEFLERSDPRVRVRLLDENQGISGNTNAALDLATGEFVAFLDHTDLLAPFALYEVARLLNRDAGTDIFYSDHDLISTEGGRYNPFFTPSWSPDLFLSVNYLAHLSVIRRRQVDEVGRLRAETDGAQDWDLLFRVAEGTDRIVRVPKVLYHWRSDPTSAALSLETKPYVAAAQERAVREHLVRRGTDASITRTGEGQLRVRWQTPERPKVSIIIPTKHNRTLLERCLGAIANSNYPDIEVVVVETAGRDEVREAWYEAMEAVVPLKVLWWEQPFNYSAVNNYAVTEATGELLLFMNDDTEPLSNEWLDELIGWAVQERVGVVGAQLVDADGRIQHGGVVVGMGGFAEHLFRSLRPGDWGLMGSTMWYRDVSAVTGACLMVRRDVFDEVGGWDEDFQLCGGDVELCLSIGRAGYRIVCTPFANVAHVEGATRGSFIPQEDFATSFWHYHSLLYGGDPFFHPALSPAHSVPTLREPEEPGPLELVSRVIERDVLPKGPSDPLAEAVGFAGRLQASSRDMEAVLRLHQDSSGYREVTTINWFVPDFESPFYGGIHTIFRFADHFLEQYGVKSRFVVIGTGPERLFRSGLRTAFPRLQDPEIFLAPQGSDDELAEVPWADASIASLWVTCYPLLRFAATARKFYLIQDFEPIFYPAGTVAALAEQTYWMGLYGVCNTPTLKEIYEQQYGGRAIGFMPAVDPIFHPGNENGGSDPYTVFFYGRPGHPRNCYELAMEALRGLKRELKDRVRIVTAGAWSGADERTDTSFVENRGLLEYRKTAELYRRCDAGLVLSVSKHPSYLPMQLMASGSLVVSNVNPAGSWLLRDEENCLLAAPTADALQEALLRGLLDSELRRRLTSRAVTDIRDSFSDWTTPMNDVYRFLCNPNGDI